MKGLKFYLCSIYPILILLLLLGGWCCRQDAGSPDGPERPIPSDSIIDDTPAKVEEDSTEDIADLPPVEERFEADVVMCIDVTGSMEGILKTVKANAMTFYSDMKRSSRRLGKDITGMRVRVIGYRDYASTNTRPPFEQSSFFTLPDEESSFKKFINGLIPDGGGDAPELGLDAIACALRSDWDSGKDTKKVIILWTDAPTKGLMANKVHNFSSSEEVVNKWNNDYGTSKKLFLFTPDEGTWAGVANVFDNTVRYNVAAGKGLSDVDYDEILKTLSEDI